MNTVDKTQAILIAVADPALHPEAMHVAAATGRPIIDTVDPADIARHFPRVSAVIIDAEPARMLEIRHQQDRVFLVASDPGPTDWKLAMQIHAESAFLLPAETSNLLAELGRSDSSRFNKKKSAGTTIGVLGAAGGVGTSTIAAALARRRRKYIPTVLVDGVSTSGGVDLLMGVEDLPGARWPDVGFTRGTVQASDVLSALPATADNVAILSTARSTVLDPFLLDVAEITAAIRCFRDAAEAIDVVIDLPAGEINKDIVGALDHLVLVVPAEVRAVAAALTQCLHLNSLQIPKSIVLRHRGWSGLDIAEVERILGVDVIAELGVVAKLAKSVEMHGLTGNLPRALVLVADAISAELKAI